MKEIISLCFSLIIKKRGIKCQNMITNIMVITMTIIIIMTTMTTTETTTATETMTVTMAIIITEISRKSFLFN